MGPGYNRDRCLKRLGPGSYSALARRTGLSRSHVGRVLRSDASASKEVIRRIAEAADVPEAHVRQYIREGGSPSNHLSATSFAEGITVVECPTCEGGPKWDPLRQLVLQLSPSDGVSTESAVIVQMESSIEARSASECLHSGRRSKKNALRSVGIRTSVRGAQLLIHRVS